MVHIKLPRNMNCVTRNTNYRTNSPGRQTGESGFVSGGLAQRLNATHGNKQGAVHYKLASLFEIIGIVNGLS